MGYSMSKITLENMRHHLVELEAGRPCSWKTTPGYSRQFATKIREALYVASIYPTEYPELTMARDTFKIRVPDDTTVVAELRLDKAAKVVRPIQEVSVANGEYTTVDALIQACYHLLGKRIKLPNARFSEEELTKLFYMLDNRDPRLMIIVDADGGLVLDRYNEDWADVIAWRPGWTPPQLPEPTTVPSTSTNPFNTLGSSGARKR